MSKAKKYEASIRKSRKAWMNEVLARSKTRPPKCMDCRSAPRWPGHAVHEICPRSMAPYRWWHPCNALLLCSGCHGSVLDNMHDWARQLALKKLFDPEHFDLEAWHLILDPTGRRNEVVTPKDVANEIAKMQNANCS